MHLPRRTLQGALTSLLAITLVLFMLRSSLCPVIQQSVVNLDRTTTSDKTNLDSLTQSPSVTTVKYDKKEVVDIYPGGSNPKTVWIVSNRRSGTHMTMDVIAQVVQGPLRIFKTNHATTDTSGDGLNCECLSWLKSQGRIVHAYRDVRDVVIAMYYYNIGFQSTWRALTLKEYLDGKKGFRDQVIKDWVLTTGGWFRMDGVLNLNYDETVTGMPYVYEKIAAFLGSSVKNLDVDPRNMYMVSGVVAKGAGKGSGGWKKYMSTDKSEGILKLARKISANVTKSMFRCEEGEEGEGKVWDMTDSYEIANSSVRAPAACPQKFLGHSEYIITEKNKEVYVTKRGTRKVEDDTPAPKRKVRKVIKKRKVLVRQSGGGPEKRIVSDSDVLTRRVQEKAKKITGDSKK